eukprot:CAMPEP_0175326392 /NCGR_PEP_ID=MMETSP0093-20121207/74512_1 /TAXON_ID=311494 /ORGANISM="Alexandrium monilatum, Strain CCMP3105" /LENGTH=42 /DNA_ID= /DNA_START= /DNA_END= /DNA_ORIENTATION=
MYFHTCESASMGHLQFLSGFPVGSGKGSSTSNSAWYQESMGT